MKKNIQHNAVKTELEGAISQLFDFADYKDVKECLWDWLKATICGDFNVRADRKQKDMLLILFEKINTLLDAANEVQKTKRS